MLTLLTRDEIEAMDDADLADTLHDARCRLEDGGFARIEAKLMALDTRLVGL